MEARAMLDRKYVPNNFKMVFIYINAYKNHLKKWKKISIN